MTVYQVTWGDALVVQVFRADGGLKSAVDKIRAYVGSAIGTRNTFAKLLRVKDPSELNETDLFRAWLLITALGADTSEFGIEDSEAVPRAYDVERLRRDLYTARDSNPEPIDLASRRTWTLEAA